MVKVSYGPGSFLRPIKVGFLNSITFTKAQNGAFNFMKNIYDVFLIININDNNVMMIITHKRIK